MKKVFRKTVLREIRNSPGRFLAIMAISALGVGFLSGLLSAGPVMRESLDRYYDSASFHDLAVQSPLGLDDDDIAAIRDISAVDAVMPFYQVDVTAELRGSDTRAVRIFSRDFEAMNAGNEDALDRLELVEGRYPEKAGECVAMSKGHLGDSLSLGAVFTVLSENENLSDALRVTEFTVVGLVRDSGYISIEHEMTRVGSGTIQDILYTSEDAFAYDVYTTAYLTLRGAAELDTYADEYLALRDDNQKQLEATGKLRSEARYKAITGEAGREIDRAQAQYDTQKQLSEQKLADAKKKLDEAQAQYDDGLREYEEGKAAYQQGLAEYQNGAAELERQRESMNAQLSAAQKEIEEGRLSLDESKSRLDEAAPRIQMLQQMMRILESGDPDAMENLFSEGQGELPEDLQSVLSMMKAVMSSQDPEKIASLAVSLHETYDDDIQQYNDGLSAWQEGQQQLQTSRDQLAQAQITWAAEEAKASASLDAAKEKLDASSEELAAAEAQLADAKTRLEQGKTDYEEGKAQADRELAEAQEKIQDAKAELEDFAEPSWIIFTRSDNVSFESFDGNMEKLEAIARVFPVFFFLVAALVALTTMTRMIEEQRVQIGTFKALGYSDGAIMGKYLMYAALATVAGCAIGLGFGLTALPAVIWNAYGIMFQFPPLHLHFYPNICLAACGVALACVLLASYAACRSSLKESPAALMLPKAPKPGKRILLERIRPLWRHMNFSLKVTARNLFRYKKRLFMTVFGVAGCTALLLTGFGLRDSIGGICDRQYGELQSYDLTVYCEDISGELTDTLDTLPSIARCLPVTQLQMTASHDGSQGGDTLEAFLVVPQDDAALPSFVTMRTRKEHEAVPFGDRAVITEKLSTALDIGIGDTITLTDTDNRREQIPVSGIIENYVNSYVYLPAGLYEEIYRQPSEPNAVLVETVGLNDAKAREDLSKQLLACDGTLSTQFTESTRNTFNNIIRGIDAVVLVIIVCAAALAFVVLYNLTNINITERQRELATLKVLGFFPLETALYIFREILLLTLLGTGLGLGLGVLLHAYIIRTVEVDMVMFGREIAPMSFLLAALFTVCFSLLVDLVMAPKLKKIDMVESLKSVD